MAGCADKVVFIVPKNDPVVTAMCHANATRGDTPYVVESLQRAPGELRGAEVLAALKHVDKDGIVVFMTDDICYAHPDCAYRLVTRIVGNENVKIAYPNCVGADRSSYLHTVLGCVPTYTYKPWDVDYVDYVNLNIEDASATLMQHTNFLIDLRAGEERRWMFGDYYLTEKDHPISSMFAGSVRDLSSAMVTAIGKPVGAANHGLHEAWRTSVIAGDALCARLAPPAHMRGLLNSDVPTRYRSCIDQSDNSAWEKSEEIIDQTSGVDIFDVLVSQKETATTISDINICISAHESDYSIVVPPLIQSLRSAGARPENIRLVCGGYDRPQDREFCGVSMHCVDHNSYDHTAIIDVAEKEPRGSWWFALHATTKVGPKFLKSVTRFGFQHDHIAVLRNGWLNMGLFSRRFIRRNTDYILGLKNCNKMQAILSEQIYPRLCREYAYYDTVPSMQILEKGDAYGDGIERQCLYFKSIDLYKYQSFHYASAATSRIKAQFFKPSKSISGSDLFAPRHVTEGVTCV